MKVSLFVHHLSSNPIVRAAPIAKAIQLLGHEVEVLGLTYYTDKVYKPYKDAFEYKTIKSHHDIRWVIINGRKLAKMATGDVAYSFKPLWGTLFPALLYSNFGLKRRLLLDAEDNELWDSGIGNGIMELAKHKYYPVNPVYNRLLHPFTHFAKYKSVVCTSLQKRYGGDIVLHGPDVALFQADLYEDRVTLREQFSLPANVPLMLFAGRPVYYNGLPSVTAAMMLPAAQNWHLVLAGDPENVDFLHAKNLLGDRCHLLGFVPNKEMPRLLKLVDVVPVLQTPIPSTQMQIPAKMLEAMSMGKGIITTDVSDMRLIVGKDQRGWIIEYGNDNQLADLLNYIENNVQELEIRGEKAISYFRENASVEVIAKRIKPYFENIK